MGKRQAFRRRRMSIFGTPLNTVKTEAPTLWTTVIAYLVPCAAFSAYILLFAC